MAMNLLARREYSYQELLSKLVGKKVPSATATRVLDQLRSDNLLSDERFVESFFQAKRNRGYGPVRIQHDLGTKGVAAELIAQRLDFTERSWNNDVVRVRRKKFGDTLPGYFEERARQARFLHYRGFTHDQIEYALNTNVVDQS